VVFISVKKAMLVGIRLTLINNDNIAKSLANCGTSLILSRRKRDAAFEKAEMIQSVRIALTVRSQATREVLMDQLKYRGASWILIEGTKL
jgi:hypothetical protein